MDAETQRLLITALISASAAIIAGLGGALFTARTNRANTIDTLEQAELADARRHLNTQEAEHDVWIRNKKIEAYTDFLEEAQTFILRLARFANESGVTAEQVLAASHVVKNHRLLLIASAEVRTA